MKRPNYENSFKWPNTVMIIFWQKWLKFNIPIVNKQNWTIYISRNEGDICQIEHYVIKENRNVEKESKNKINDNKIRNGSN
jgi:hypothetical protein